VRSGSSRFERARVNAAAFKAAAFYNYMGLKIKVGGKSIGITDQPQYPRL
jgi:hypothetical protein